MNNNLNNLTSNISIIQTSESPYLFNSELIDLDYIPNNQLFPESSISNNQLSISYQSSDNQSSLSNNQSSIVNNERIESSNIFNIKPLEPSDVINNNQYYNIKQICLSFILSILFILCLLFILFIPGIIGYIWHPSIIDTYNNLFIRLILDYLFGFVILLIIGALIYGLYDTWKN